ncbi:MAG: hypothetical protein QF569_00730 [Candidatus Poribacteria bacterium]|nr:hypothetical protein [Candidatus Poribacteria bacterium]
MPERNLELPDQLRNKLTTRFILYKMIEEKEEVPALLNDNYQYIEDIINTYYDDYWVIQESNGNYTPTRKGELIYQNFIAQWWDFLLSYDIFAGVDLLNGVFAEEDADWEAVDEEGRPIWEDLRVAVCIYKQRVAQAEGRETDLNPFTIAFMSLLSERRIGQENGWQFDLYSEEFWYEVTEIVNTNLWPEDLGYIDPDSGDEVLGEDVTHDIIEQGIEETRQRWEEDDDDDDGDYLLPPSSMSSREQVVEEYEEEVVSYGWGYDPFYYDPYPFAAGGALTVLTIAAVWAILD